VNDVLKINDESCGNKFESDNGYNFSAYLDINENLTNVELNSKPNRYAIEFVLEPEMSDLPDDIDLKFYINAYLPDDAYLYTDMAWKTEGQRDDVSDKNIEVKYNDGLGKYIMYYSHDHVCDDSNCIHKDFWFTFDNEYNYPTYKLEFAYQNANGDKIESPLDAKDGKQYRFKVIAELITYSINLEGDNKSVENLSVYTMNTNGSSVQEIVVTPNTGYRFSTDGHIEEFKDVTLQLSTKLDDTDDEEDNPTEYEDYIIFRIYKNGVVKYSFDGDDFKEINISSSGFTYDEVSKYSFNLNLGTKRVRFYFVEKPYLTTDYEIVFSLGVIYEFEADLTLTFKVAPNKYGLFLKESDGCDIFEELEYSYATINDVYYDKEISLVYTINAAYTNLKNLKFTRGTEVFEYGDGPFFGSEITERKIEDNKLTIVIKVKGPLGYITISADKNEYTTGLYYRNGEEVVAWDHNTHKHLLQPSVDTSNAKHGEEVTLVIDEVIGNVFTSFEVRTYDSENNNFSLIPSCKISDLTFDDNNKASTDDGLFTITKAWLRDIEGSECTNDKQLSYTITYTQTSNMDFVLNVEAREIKVTFNYIKPSYNPESDKTEYVASDYMREDVIYNTSWSEYKTYLLESCDFQFSGFAGLAFAGFIKLDASAIDGYTYQWTDSNDNIISLKEGIKTLDNSDKKSIFVKDKFETSELVQNFTDIDGVYYAVYTRKEITTQVYFEGVEEAPITLRWKVGMSFDDAKVWILQEGEWITYNESFGSYMNQLKTRNNMHYLSNTTYSCLATDYEERDLRNISTLATDWEELADKLEQVHYYFEDKTLTLQLNSSHEIKASVVIDGTNNIPDIRPFVKYTQEFVVKDTEGKVVIIVNTNNNSNYFYALQLVDEGTNTYNIVRYKRSVDEGSYQYTPVSYTMEDINDELLFMVGKTANNNALKLDNISSGDYWGYSTDNGSGYKLFGDNCDNYNILNKENINNTTTKFKYEVVFIDNILVEYVIELDNGTATPTQYIARVYGSELASVETIVGKFTTVGGSNYNAGFSKDVLIATYLVDPSGEGWHDKFSDKTGIDIEESDDLSKWGNAELWKSDNTIISGVTISDNKLSDDVPAGFSHYRVSLTGKRGSIEYPFLVSNNTTWNNVVNVYSTDDNYLRNGNELYNFLQVADLDLGTNATGDTMAAGEYDFYGNYNVRNGVVKITGDLLRPMFGNIANGTIDGINILGNSRAVYAAKIPDEWETSTIHFGILALSADQTVYNDEEEVVSTNNGVQKLEQNAVLSMCSREPLQHFTQPAPHYTEASLVREIEELGIGRPSTYATTVTTILARRYIIKEDKNLYVTELGEAVNDIMKTAFPSIVDVNFTANMEYLLDSVEEGTVAWKTVVRNFYPDLEEAVKNAQTALEKVEINDEETDVVCEECGRNMVIKYGKHGKFLACPGFPECKNTKTFLEKTGVQCPKCGADIVVRRTKKGRRYFGCENAPECDYMSWQKPSAEGKKDN